MTFEGNKVQDVLQAPSTVCHFLNHSEIFFLRLCTRWLCVTLRHLTHLGMEWPKQCGPFSCFLWLAFTAVVRQKLTCL